jgi:AAA+ ATPase superfamily predicted ATPase
MHEFPFVGRTNELKNLADLAQKRSSSLIVIRGRRRIGKSRLVEEFARNHRFLRFAGLAPTEKTTAQSQREEFSKQLAQNLNTPQIIANEWSDLFQFLARETKQGRVIILLDEISWMGSKDDDFLGKLKNAWDHELKKNPELILILCGSVSAWIEKNILRSTGFMGRLSLVLDLEELTVPECNQLLTTIGFRGNAYEKFKILSVTGGIPRYLEEIKPDRLADENIKDMCFIKNGVLFREFQDIFLDIFARRSETYKKIVETLVDGDKEFLDIANCLGMLKSGHVSEYLNDLIQSGFIRRDYTWNVKGGKASSLSRYRLSDNYLRFFLKYIEKNKNKIESKHFENQPLSTLPGFDSIMGLQFENLVLNNRDFIWKKLHIHPGDIITDNPYFQRAQLRKKGCQIDYLIQTRMNVLYACEIKFSKNEIKPEIVQQMKQKLDNIFLPRGFSIMPVLIHVNGITEGVTDTQYFSHIVNFSDLLF